MMYTPSQFQVNQVEDITIYKVQNLQIALQKAMDNITQLQNNLSFMIKFNEQLKQQNLNQKNKSSKTIQELQIQLLKKDKQLILMKNKHEDYQNLLTQTKQALVQCQNSIVDKDEEVQRLERIINEQRKTISHLQTELVSNKENQVSMQSNSSYYMHFDQLQKELQEYKYQNKRLTTNLQKEQSKIHLLEKQASEFRKWLSQASGIEGKKIVSGCQKIIMEQIKNRLQHIR